MREFSFERAPSVEALSAALLAEPDAKIIAGGTNLVDLMKEGVERPAKLIEINRVDGLSEIEARADGSVRLGALVSNSACAWHEAVQARFPMVSQALLHGATTQLRNMATIGGNLLQKTRCPYYTDLSAPCNRRRNGTGCAAIGGANRMCAVLGTNERCIAAHPSDLCVALVALDAVVELQNGTERRQVALRDFYLLPGEDPSDEYAMRPGDVIVAVEIPALPHASRSTYLKLRDRTSYAFALVSVAAAVALDGDRIADIRLALGGVGSVPWRAGAAEDVLRGQVPTQDRVREATEAVFADAAPRSGNAFKVELAKRAISRVVREHVEAAR